MVGGLILVWAAVLAPAGATAQGLDVEGLLARPGVKLVAVEFYATWCKPCMAAVPKWKALHDKYRKDGLRLVVIATQDADGACANPGWSPDEVICDDDGFLAQRFGATSLPAAYLWGWQGHLLAKKAHVEEVEAQIERWMRQTPRVDVEVERVARGARISKRNLLSALRAELNRSDKLTVVATAAERKKLRDIVRKSLSSEFADDKMACDATLEISANSLLQATITGGKKKRLQLKLLSAERGCLVASGATHWNPNKASASIGEAVAKLTARLRLAKTQYPWSGGALRPQALGAAHSPSAPAAGQSYEALLAKAEAAKKAAEQAQAMAESQRKARTKALNKAWAAVSKIAESAVLSKEERLGALASFLKDYPADNPHIDTARDYERLLKAGKQPVAAPPDMVNVPAGEFHMGCNERVDTECARSERPGKRVRVGAFFIDTTEVTVAAYKKCVDAGACSAQVATQAWNGKVQPGGEHCNWGKSGRANHPLNCVTWRQAVAFCKWSGKRLPSDMEWEKAARGTDGRKYPWGNGAYGETKVANIPDRQAKARFRWSWASRTYDDGYATTAPVGTFRAGDSPYGAQDMVGNVFEWTSGRHAETGMRVIRGGAWYGKPSAARASFRSRSAPAARLNYVGFRCARSD